MADSSCGKRLGDASRDICVQSEVVSLNVLLPVNLILHSPTLA